MFHVPDQQFHLHHLKSAHTHHLLKRFSYEIKSIIDKPVHNRPESPQNKKK